MALAGIGALGFPFIRLLSLPGILYGFWPIYKEADGYLSTTLNNVPLTIAAGGAGQANFYLSLAAPDVRRVAQVISGAGSYDFGPSEVEIAVTDDASCLTGITVQRHESSHPSTIPGIQSHVSLVTHQASRIICRCHK